MYCQPFKSYNIVKQFSKMSLWTEDDGHVPNHYWPILLTLTSNNCLPHSRVKPVIFMKTISFAQRKDLVACG